VELVLAVEKGGVEVVEALVVAVLLRGGDGGAVVAEADAVAENAQVDRVLDLLQVLQLEDVLAGVQARRDLVPDRTVRVFLHYYEYSPIRRGNEGRAGLNKWKMVWGAMIK
jgi:hypothetical protein